MSAGSAPRGTLGLEYYVEPFLYESTFRYRTEDVEFFVAEARGRGPVLEFGAGSGRVTLPVARAGEAVTAVDLSEPMLALLDERLRQESVAVRSRVKRVQGDMRTLRLGKTYQLVLATFNVVGHLHTPEDLGAFLDTAEAHLAPGGSLIFDSMVPSSEELDADPEEPFECDPFVDPESGELTTPYERFAYDPETRLLTVRTTYESRGRTKEGPPLVLRQWFPRELEAILRARTYASLAITADYETSTDLTDAEMLVVRAVSN